MGVRVLQIVRGSGSYGGVASYLLSRYKLINHDEVHFDFLFCQLNSFGDHNHDSEINDSYIGELRALKKRNLPHDYAVLYYRLKSFLKDHPYDIIHVNTGSLPVTAICLLAAKKCGIRMRIAHSHSSNYKNGLLNTRLLFRPIRSVLQKTIVELSTDRLACSEIAAKNMFGQVSYQLMKNGINVEEYRFNQKTREAIRKQFGWNQKKVIGFVGRLEESKNIPFVIEVVKSLNITHESYLLLIIGDGNERDNIARIILDNKMDNSVRILGSRTDVPDLLQAMDGLVLPSKYEGLSITAVEAQTAGLPVFLSDNLSIEHGITELVHFLPLCVQEWTKAIDDCLNGFSADRNKYYKIIKNAGYSISDCTKELVDLYIKQE